MDKSGYVYIMANRRNGTLYTGVTSDIVRRGQQHREGLIPGFTLENGCKALVWYEAHGDIESAIRREKTIKKWQRQWKFDLIEKTNPDWHDLWPTLFGGEPGDALPR